MTGREPGNGGLSPPSSGVFDFSPDGRRLLQTTMENGVEVWEIEGSRKIATFQAFPDSGNDGIIFTPDGYYRTTSRRVDRINWVKGARKTYSFDQFDLRYN